MAYTENWLELRWGGTAWAGQETWSCGTKLKQLGGDSPGPMQDAARALEDDWLDVVAAYYGDPNALYSAGTRLTWVRANVINAQTGKYYYPNSPNVFEYDSPIVPPSESGGSPNRGYPQIAYCVTLRSAIKRGPAARGRWYVPCAIAGGELTTSTGVMPISSAQARADAAGTFLSAVANLAPPTELDPFSPWLYGEGETTSADAAVQTVSVGNVYDTQRRRRAQIEETYALSTTWDPT